jgi:FkbM family methyltransferase
MLKKIVRNFIGLLGWEITKIQVQKNGNKVEEYKNIKKEGDEIKTITIGRFEILINSDNPLTNLFKHYPYYSSELGRLVAAMQRKYPGLTLIDVGANVGDTVAIARSAADISIVCIEGDNFCFSLLKQNIKQFGNVSAYNLFLGDKTETISVTLEKQGCNTTIIPSQQEHSLKLELTSLDEFLENHSNYSNYKILKIDTEGFDTKVIRGGLNYIKTIKPVLHFEYNRDNMTKIGEDGISTLFFLEQLGYNKTLFYEATGRFVLSTSLRNKNIILQLHNYADGYNSSIYYFDICVFHEQDDELADLFIKSEEYFNIENSGKPLYKIS